MEEKQFDRPWFQWLKGSRSGARRPENRRTANNSRGAAAEGA
jgi:hypothetical protein